MFLAAIPMMFVAMAAGSVIGSTFIGPRKPPTRWEKFKDGVEMWAIVGLVILEACVMVGVGLGLAWLIGILFL